MDDEEMCGPVRWICWSRLRRLHPTHSLPSLSPFAANLLFLCFLYFIAQHLDLSTDYTSFKAYAYSAPTLADIDGDGKLEVILGTSMVSL